MTDGRPDLQVFPGGNPIRLDALHVEPGAQVLVDGLVVGATVSCLGGTFSPDCTSGEIEVDLDAEPTGTGMHLLQIQNPSGLLSNELPIIVLDLGHPGAVADAIRGERGGTLVS